MLEKYKCKECGKEYFADFSLGTWQKDGKQAHNCSGVSVKNFCSYECGKLSRKKAIQNTFSNMSNEEKLKRKKLRASKTKSVKCSVCGKLFEVLPSHSSKLHFCSDKCRMIYNYKLPQSGKMVCIECGKIYDYEQGMGNWTKNGDKIWSKGIESNGKGKELTIPSHKFCSYECGIKHKERLRNKTNIEKYGITSPFQNTDFFIKLHEKLLKEGTLFVSKGENEVKEFVESLGFKTQKLILGAGNSTNKQRIEIDIFIPEKNIGIEYNGSWFHSINGKKENIISKSYHYQKSKFLEEKGYELIHIWEDQWLNQNEIIKDIIKTRLGVMDGEKIYARQCEIREIDNETYKIFCNTNHIQGYHKASVKLGLYYKNKLVQIASFSKNRNLGKSKKDFYEWEWIRGCIASNNKVIGGTTKLFKYFVKVYDPKSVLCYADFNLFNGKGYEKCNFEFKGFTGPDKFYITAHNTMRINRSPYRYKEYKELVKQKKLLECFGAGSKKYVWKKF